MKAQIKEAAINKDAASHPGTAELLLMMMNNSRLNCCRFDYSFNDMEGMDRGLRAHLYPGDPKPYEDLRKQVAALPTHSAIFMTDGLGCRYFICSKNDRKEGPDEIITIGPYLAEPLHDPALLKNMKKWNLPEVRFEEIRGYYQQLPCIAQESIRPVLRLFADSFFEDSSYETVDFTASTAAITSGSGHSAPAQLDPAALEYRYQLENELMQQIRNGDTRKAITVFHTFAQASSSMAPRLSDRLRDRKDLLITLNTISRKASEQAGVHPWYIDHLSNQIIPMIEQTASEAESDRTNRAIIERYCSLVRELSFADYSELIREAARYINRNLSAELTLQGLADICNVNASYLSARFKKETGYAPIEYINRRRVRQAGFLLVTTPLPVRSIAEQVGFTDYNYFSRVFHRITGISPSGYRRN